MYLSVKYWLYHKKQALSVLSVIVIGTAVITMSILMARSASQKTVSEKLDICGDYDIVSPDITEDKLQLLQAEKKFSKAGIIINGGICKTENGSVAAYGAMKDLETEKLYHFTPESGGRYPVNTGEICGYKTTFEAMGVGAVIGNKITLERYDKKNKSIGTKEFTIVGVFNDQRDISNDYIRKIADLQEENTKETNLPQLFVSKEEIDKNRTLTALLLCQDSDDPHEMQTWMKEKGISAYNSWRIEGLSAIAGIECRTEREMYEKTHFAYRDFYSTYMIPFFSGIIFIISFISIFGITTSAMLERLKQLGTLRSIGMTHRRALRMLSMEFVFFCLTGVGIGYGFGVGIYFLYRYISMHFGETIVYDAFHAHRIACAISLNPHTYPWIFSLLFVAASFLVCLWRISKYHIMELMYPEKNILVKRKRGTCRRGRMLFRYIGGMLNQNIGVVVILFVTTWSFVFGVLFMLAQAAYDSEEEREALKKISVADADYSVKKDFDEVLLANVQFNRQNEGVSEADYKKIKECEEVRQAIGIIKVPGCKLLYQKGQGSEALRDFLEPFNIRNNIEEFLIELDQKSLKMQGYEKEDTLYNFPAVAVDGKRLKDFEKYIVAGKIDSEGIRQGKKLLLVEYGNDSLETYFHPGDVITISDTVISDEKIEAYDFSENVMPNWIQPSFTYDYPDKSMKNLPGYSFGQRLSHEIEVCGILRITDRKVREMMYQECYVADAEGNASKSYNILFAKDALKGLGYRDRNNTDVYVYLKDGAEEKRFETLWYSVIGHGGRTMKCVSRKAMKNNIRKTELSNIYLFVSMIIMVIFLGLFGMVNSYHFAIKKNMKKLQILRAIGLSKRKLLSIYIREMFLWPVAAGLTSVLPVVLFDAVRKYAYHYAFELGHNGGTTLENGKVDFCWQVFFPWYIELWKQPVFPMMILGIVVILLVNIFAGVVSMNTLTRFNVVDGIRNEEF